MRILFIHMGFPAQYRHLVPRLVARGDQLTAILPHRRRPPVCAGVRVETYQLQRGSGRDVHPLAQELEAKVLRAEAVAQRAAALKADGFEPHLIVGHPGWGEMLFLHAVWPHTPQLHYVEFFYGVPGTDCDIQDIHAPEVSLDQRSRLTMKNANPLLNLQQMHKGMTPTRFQHSLLPVWAQARTQVIHDGIDTTWLRPDPTARLQLPSGKVLQAGEPIVTFVNRTFEPYRGIHIFLEALSKAQARLPQMQAVLVGADRAEVSYGRKRSDDRGWLAALCEQYGDQLDWSRIHPLGTVDHATLRRVYQISAAHIYLTYPFVLSWSMLEAMACGCLVIGSDVAPVAEIIQSESNGFLVPFQDAEELSKTIVEALSLPSKHLYLRKSARKTIKQGYSLEDCLSKQIEYLDSALT